MNRVRIDRSVLRRNLAIIEGLMEAQGARWCLVTKVLCGHLEALHGIGSPDLRAFGDTRLENLAAVRREIPHGETWYLRPPHMSAARKIVDLCDVSLNTEMESLEALDAAARQAGTVHRVVVMVEIGDLREGVLPSGLIAFFRALQRLDHLHVLGVGANVGCLSGTVPTIEQLSPLPLYRRLLEYEFDKPLPIVSAGSSVVLSALQRGNVPSGINHYRIGEAAFLGTDLIRGGFLDGLENAVTLEAEIIEIKRKNLMPLGEISGDISPFPGGPETEGMPGERGHRALVSIGQMDTEVRGLVPTDPEHSIAGASSDITVVNLGENRAGLSVGDTIRFRPDYSAVARAMSSQYLQREVVDPEADTDAGRHPGGSAAPGLTQVEVGSGR